MIQWDQPEKVCAEIVKWINNNEENFLNLSK
jgi:hypothetical protein